jgi:hypothetical protein
LCDVIRNLTEIESSEFDLEILARIATAEYVPKQSPRLDLVNRSEAFAEKNIGKLKRLQ